MSGPPVDGTPVRWFSHYPPDFFAFILIDECHRGGATNESNWRGILEHFAAAMQLGLTATPRRSENTDTYAYVSDPVFTDSLKEGITDAFLTPLRVKPFTTTLDEYIYTPDDTVVEGEIEAGGPTGRAISFGSSRLGSEKSSGCGSFSPRSISANDSELGSSWLRAFQDNEKTIPTILTTP